MINIYYRSIREVKTESLEEFRVGSWVDVCDPTEREIEEVCSLLGTEASLLRDALDPYEVPRLEQENGFTYVFTRVPEKEKGETITMPILIVLGDSFIMTVSRVKFGFLDKFRSGSQDFFTTQKIKFFLGIFSTINRQYSISLIDISKRIRGLKIRLERMNSKDLIHFVDFERILNDFLSALIPTASVLKNILDGRSMSLYEEDKDLIEDIFLGNGQMVEMAKSTLRHVVNIRDTYSNIITQELNRVIKMLTSLTVILTVPTMIFSFYGMNIDLPLPEYLRPHWFILVLTAIFVMTLISIFRKNRWL